MRSYGVWLFVRYSGEEFTVGWEGCSGEGTMAAAKAENGGNGLVTTMGITRTRGLKEELYRC